MIKNPKEKIFELFDGPTLSQLATIDCTGRPWVRYVMSTIDRDMILRVPTGRTTRKVRDIREHPSVHLLVGKNLFTRNGAYAQIEGHAVVTADPLSRSRQWNRSMERYFEGPADPNYVLIEIRPFRMEYWSAMEEENPAIVEACDLVCDPDDSHNSDEYWVSEGRTAPVYAL